MHYFRDSIPVRKLQVVARIYKNFEQNKPCGLWCSNRKEYMTVFKSQKKKKIVLNLRFTCNFTFNTTKHCLSALLPVIL